MKEKFHMSDEYYSLKRVCYACVCITPEFNGSCTIWDTREEAWNDAKERVDELIGESDGRLYYKEVYDGFEIYDASDRIIRCYKVFDAQELE